MTAPRWAVSLADLGLLLLGFFILLYAGSARDVAAGARAAFASRPAAGPLLDAAAAHMFEPGEARLNPSTRLKLERIGRRVAARKGPVVILSEGSDPGASRFDEWELAAARAAALARTLAESGLKQDRLRIVMPAEGRGETSRGQRLTLRLGA